MTSEQKERFRQYIESEEGKEVLLRISLSTSVLHKEMRERTKPEWLTMHRPMDI